MSKAGEPFDDVCFRDDLTVLYQGDALEVLERFEGDSFDFCFADPPYFLSNGGTTCRGGRRMSVDKGKWDQATLAEKRAFNRRWLTACARVLKPGATIAVSATFHNLFSVGSELEDLDFRILNIITWRKLNPPPNLSCRYLTHSTEFVVWARKGQNTKHVFNYQDMKAFNGGKQMKDVLEGPLTPRGEKRFGRHPTQKPEYLLDFLLRCATVSESVVLDPFLGSGTTCVVAERLHRRSVGIEVEGEYLEIARQRLSSLRD